MDTPVVTNSAYLVAAVLFFLGFKRLSHPSTARTGNIMAAVGMLIAVVVTLLDREVLNWPMILAGIVVGSAIGLVLARTIHMTAMPQMVGMFNGFGGGASATVASAELIRLTSAGGAIALDVNVTIMLGVLIGGVTFSGSMVAFAKLQEVMTTRPIRYRFQNPINLVLFLGIVAIAVYLVVAPVNFALFGVLVAAALVLGILLVIPIGGADMPVVISLLNSYSGLAATTAGFVLNNTVLITSGALVGASGLILTNLMCKAMNRSLVNVIFGAFGVPAGAPMPVGGRDGARPVRAVSADDAAVALAYARSVIFVPGYGLAAAQAQHHARQLADLLDARGVEVKYAIHPVAGRMPGHMNVLLAEANVPYNQLFDLEQVNSDFERTDVAIVVGANDVTNPVARTDPSSPIYGMPILNVDKARSIIFLKRSLSPGFAGIDNELFYSEKTMMLFSDARDGLSKLITAVKGL